MGGGTFLTLDLIPVGFRFSPTDEELVGHYLKHKLLGDDSSAISIIPDFDLRNVDPWQLLVKSVMKSDDPEQFFFNPLSHKSDDEPEWFFFSPHYYKYASSSYRATIHGYWKSNGDDHIIKGTGTNNVIGTKKTLVFYYGRNPGSKSNWVLHEYHHAVPTFDHGQRTFVLCRLMRKAENYMVFFHKWIGIQSFGHYIQNYLSIPILEMDAAVDRLHFNLLKRKISF